MSDERIWPDITDDDLWECIKADIGKQYPGRFTEAYIRDAFERTCAKFDDYVPLAKFIKKMRMTCLWERPLVAKEILFPEDYPGKE